MPGMQQQVRRSRGKSRRGCRVSWPSILGRCRNAVK